MNRRPLRLATVNLILWFGMSACSPTATPTNAPAQTKAAPVAETKHDTHKPTVKVAVARSPGGGTHDVLVNYYKALGARDLEWLPSFLTDDYQRLRVNPTPGTTPTMSRAKYLAGLKFFFDKLTDAKVIPLVLLSSGNKSASIYRIDSGNGTSIVHAELAEHTDKGVILSSRVYSSDLEFVIQAGVRKRNHAEIPAFEWPPTIAIRADLDEAEQDNVAIAKRLRSATNNLNIREFVNLASPAIDIVSHNGRERKQGHAAARSAFAAARRFAITKREEYLSIWGAGDWVVMEVSSTSTLQNGPLRGVPIAETELLFLRIEDQKVAEIHSMGNEVGVFIQMGIDDAKQVRTDVAQAFERLFSGCKDVRNCTTKPN